MDVIKNAGRRSAIMSKVEDILASTKVGDVLDAAKLNKFLKRQEEEEKKPSKFVIVFAVIGIVVAVAAAIYGIYRFFTPDYLDDCIFRHRCRYASMPFFYSCSGCFCDRRLNTISYPSFP
jgi:hypothetical protein